MPVYTRNGGVPTAGPGLSGSPATGPQAFIKRNTKGSQSRAIAVTALVPKMGDVRFYMHVRLNRFLASVEVITV